MEAIGKAPNWVGARNATGFSTRCGYGGPEQQFMKDAAGRKRARRMLDMLATAGFGLGTGDCYPAPSYDRYDYGFSCGKGTRKI